MKAILILAAIFVGVMLLMKSCTGGGLSGVVGGFKGAVGVKEGMESPIPKAAKAGAPPASGPVSVVKGPGYTLHAEKFRGFMGFTSTLRTDQGQYTPGALCHHGLVMRVNEREAAIKGAAGLVVVVAVDDYTHPPVLPEPVKEEDKKNALANPPPPVVNASPVAVVPVVKQVVNAPAMADVPREQSLALTRQQQRQAQRGVLVKGPFKSELKMGP